MNLLIFGASGKTGQELVKQSLEQGHKVTAFVRHPSKLNVQHQNLAITQGDINNTASVQSAVMGKDAVFSTLGASSPFKFDQSVVDGLGHIVKIIEQVNGKRFIYMSAINVKESRHTAGIVIRILAPILLRAESAGHEAREGMIRQSNLEWTIVRPGGLTDGKRTAVYRSGEDVKAKGIASAISRADVADFMIRQLTDRSNLRKAVSLMY